jgi:hypothetical protein
LKTLLKRNSTTDETDMRVREQYMEKQIMDGANGMDLDRALHLRELTRDIQRWKAKVDRLEREGNATKAKVIRKWIKSAERVARLLERISSA